MPFGCVLQGSVLQRTPHDGEKRLLPKNVGVAGLPCSCPCAPALASPQCQPPRPPLAVSYGRPALSHVIFIFPSCAFRAPPPPLDDVCIMCVFLLEGTARSRTVLSPLSVVLLVPCLAQVGDDEEGIPPTALREMSILRDLSDVPNIVE